MWKILLIIEVKVTLKNQEILKPRSSQSFQPFSSQMYYRYVLNVYVCVCVRERERERENFLKYFKNIVYQAVTFSFPLGQA